MLVPASQTPEQLPLKVVTNNKTANGDNALVHAIARKAAAVKKTAAICKPEPAMQVVESQQASNNFTITFSYAQQLHRTKVLKIGSGYRKPAYLYKVVLNSRLSSGEARLCWLQKTTQGWEVILGDNVNATLVNAITTAIESME